MGDSSSNNISTFYDNDWIIKLGPNIHKTIYNNIKKDGKFLSNSDNITKLINKLSSLNEDHPHHFKDHHGENQQGYDFSEFGIQIKPQGKFECSKNQKPIKNTTLIIHNKTSINNLYLLLLALALLVFVFIMKLLNKNIIRFPI